MVWSRLLELERAAHKAAMYEESHILNTTGPSVEDLEAYKNVLETEAGVTPRLAADFVPVQYLTYTYIPLHLSSG